MAVREGDDAAVGRGRGRARARSELDERLSPGVDLSRRLTARATVGVKLPIGLRFVDLGGGQAFVAPVVDLAQELGDARCGESRKLAGAPRTLERARVRDVEVDAMQASGERARPFPA